MTRTENLVGTSYAVAYATTNGSCRAKRIGKISHRRYRQLSHGSDSSSAQLQRPKCTIAARFGTKPRIAYPSSNARCNKPGAWPLRIGCTMLSNVGRNKDQRPIRRIVRIEMIDGTHVGMGHRVGRCPSAVLLNRPDLGNWPGRCRPSIGIPPYNPGVIGFRTGSPCKTRRMRAEFSQRPICAFAARRGSTVHTISWKPPDTKSPPVASLSLPRDQPIGTLAETPIQSDRIRGVELT